tara:strand:- start:54 stop:956 length:903 start_codon:yes stop_codon:yes gene_type:complete
MESFLLAVARRAADGPAVPNSFGEQPTVRHILALPDELISLVVRTAVVNVMVDRKPHAFMAIQRLEPGERTIEKVEKYYAQVARNAKGAVCVMRTCKAFEACVSSADAMWYDKMQELSKAVYGVDLSYRPVRRLAPSTRAPAELQMLIDPRVRHPKPGSVDWDFLPWCVKHAALAMHISKLVSKVAVEALAAASTGSSFKREVCDVLPYLFLLAPDLFLRLLADGIFSFLLHDIHEQQDPLFTEAPYLRRILFKDWRSAYVQLKKGRVPDSTTTCTLDDLIIHGCDHISEVVEQSPQTHV